MLRAYAKYLRQAGTTFSQDYIERVLRSNTTVTRLLVRLFESRFDPARQAGQAERSEAITEEIRGELDDVAMPGPRPDPARLPGPDPGHAADQLLRGTPERGRRQHAVPGRSSWTRRRCPTCPRRGRSSSCSSTRRGWRRCTCGSPPWPGAGCAGRTGGEDFRTEILGLAKAQEVKNSVIVPSGAKGGFVCKQLPDPADREALPGRGAGLLPDVHQRHAGRDRQPAGRPGGAAAGRGPARRRRPVPGGRGGQGHRHVLRHGQRDRHQLRVLAGRRVRLRRVRGLRPQEDGHHRPRRLGVGQVPLRHARRGHRRPPTSPWPASATCPATCSATGCCCPGTSSWSRAFDHRHVFLDPEPDPAASFAERQRLFALPRSSWADYDPALISAGGGVWPRTRQVDPGVPAGPPGARAGRGRPRAVPGPADLGHPGGAGGPAVERRHRHLRQGQQPVARRRRGPGQRRGPHRRRRSCAPRWSARAATWA